MHEAKYPDRTDLVDRAVKRDASANTSGDEHTSAHVSDWMKFIRSFKQPNAMFEAGYYHSIAKHHEYWGFRTGTKATLMKQRSR